MIEILEWLEAVAKAEDIAAGGKPNVKRIERTAAREIVKLRATISRLREYARHDPSCKSWGRIPCPCDCGYDELMKELEESK